MSNKSDIGDLFGDYATPFKKKILQKLAESKNPERAASPRHITKNCSDCDSQQAWYSSDHGTTWQCFNHKKH